MLIRLFLLMVGITLVNTTSAQNTKSPTQQWEASKHYFLIDPPQPTASGDKVEVIEVFSYACPHCSEFQPFADKLRSSLPTNVQWDYLPAEFQPGWQIFARVYYTAQVLNIVDKTHQPLFNAIYVDHKITLHSSMEDLAKFYANYGVKNEDFIATAQSFAIETKLRRARALVKAYAVDGTPSIIINGKYRVTIQSAGSRDNLLNIVHYLVVQESAGTKSVK